MSIQDQCLDRKHQGLYPQQHRVTGDEEATRLLRRPYRAPYVHPVSEKV